MRRVKHTGRNLQSLSVVSAWIRDLSRSHILTLFVTLYIFVALGVARWIIVPTLSVVRDSRDRSALRARLEMERGKLLEELRSNRAELDLYVNGSRGKERSMFQDAESNATFNHIHAIANEVGVAVQAFEQAVRSSEVEASLGFTRVKIETNFLQMTRLMEKLSENHVPLIIEKFSFSNLDRNSDRLSISLTLSTISPRPPVGRRCHL